MRSTIILSALATTAWTLPVIDKREVPQEHSHEKFLTVTRNFLLKNNPDGIVDPVFGLLGDAAAKAGLGRLTDTSCLQTATADRAFTNAKAANDVNGMVGALVFRALERNTGKVGLQSNPCTSFTPVNPQIAALKQHQDPASPGAAATNRAIELELAKQIAAVGGDPQIALQSATFAPGSTSDNTGKGNTCDDQNDPTGCALSRGLTVPQISAEDIKTAVAGSSSSSSTGSSSGSNAAPPASGQCPPQATVTVTVTAGSSTPTVPATTTNNNNLSGGSPVNLGAAFCSDPAIAFGPGFNGRKATEFTFQPDDPATFTHGEALNPGIIAQFICDRLNDHCHAPADTLDKCRTATSAIQGKTNDPNAAKTFNDALSVTASKIGISAGPSSSSSSASGNTNNNNNNNNNNSSSPSSTSSSSSKFGLCSTPALKFAPAADRGGVNAFQTVDGTDFPHGSVQAINVLTTFLCQQLHDKCHASDDVLAACQRGASAANPISSQGQAAADAFNQALGI